MPEDSQLTLPAESLQVRHKQTPRGLLRCVLESCCSHCSDGPETKPDVGNFGDPSTTYMQVLKANGTVQEEERHPLETRQCLPKARNAQLFPRAMRKWVFQIRETFGH